MQCPSCGFENIPGLAACARCQGRLNLAAVAVEPARAGRLRLRNRLLRIRYALRPDLSGLRGRLPRWPTALLEPLPGIALLLTVVPGLGQLWLGQRRLGCTLLGAWAALLAGTLLSLATPATPWLLAGAVFVHATAVISLFAANLSWERLLIRVLFGVAIFVGLQQLVYRPLAQAGQRLVVPLRVNNFVPGGVVRNGDGLIYEGPGLRPDAFVRGDVVVYEIHQSSGEGWYLPAGHGLDRVVGIPGDHVQIEAGVLRVNGRVPPAGEAPLGPLELLPPLEGVLGPDEYLIVPSLLAFAQQEQWAAIIRRAMVVKESEIRGRVLLRLHPWVRFGRVGAPP